MEFEEMKKIWDAQNSEPFYGINEEALHHRILSKKKTAHHITNISELLGIIAYSVGAAFIVAVNFAKPGANISMYLLAAWMLCSALYLLVSRIRRTRGNQRFDRSIRGDLNHAIAMATYQVRLSLIMRWNIVPIAILALMGIWNSGKSVWVVLAILAFFIVSNYASGWEHRIYKNKKRELEVLQDKLGNEDAAD